ncbi:MAG: hypothetical protein R6X02_18945 [Enhygromyxa sp.]
MTALEPVILEEGRVTVELRAGYRIERLDVRQLTPDWLGVEITGGWEFEDPTMAIKLDIVGPGGFVEQFRCEIEFGGWVSVSGNLDGEKVGVARLLLLCERHERSELVRIYRQLRFPALFERGELDANRLVELIERTGYCSLRDGICPSAAWCAADFPPELSVDAVYASDKGELLGHVSVTRAYSRTWVGHQLTVVEDHLETPACRATLYNHFATVPVLIDGHQQQYLLSYYDRSKPWHQLFFESFVDWFDDPDMSAIVPFDRYEVDANAASADVATLELDQVRPDELERVLALIREQLPPLACAAFDIEAAMLDRAYLHPDFAASGIARGRRVFVVREAGELVGAALCETGSEDLSLYNLFNLAQLYFRAGASSVAQQALVHFVRCHYRAIGQADPLLVAPAGSLDEPQDAGLELVETLGCMIWSGHTLRAYRTFLRTTFGRVARRSAKPATRVESVYLPKLADARARLQSEPRLRALLDGSLDGIELLGFLLNFSALGVRINAGEPERERLLLDDLFDLGQRWRIELGARINVELLLHQPPPRSLLRWMDLREVIAEGPCPSALLALELELSDLHARLGPALLQICERTLGAKLRPSFWAALGSDALEQASARLERLLESESSSTEAIAEAGRAGLELYLELLGDCVELGRELAERVRATSRVPANTAPSRIRLAFA